MAIINNNVQNVKFLRNQDVNITRDSAIALLDAHKGEADDGTSLLVRYTVSGEVKTIIGYVAVVGETHHLTIIDVEGGSEDVEKLRQEINAKLGEGITSANTATAQLAALSGNPSTSTSAETSVEGAKRYADAKISDLDYTGVTTGDGVYVTNVTQADGIVSATTATLPTVTDAKQAKKVVVSVSEDKGTISIERGTISSTAETIVLTDNADGGVNFEVNIDNDTIVQDETSKKLKVASAALTQYVGDGKTIEISAADANNNKTVSTLLTLSSVTPSSTTVKEEYALKNASGETIGSTIKIYKDSSLVSIELVNEDPTQDPPKAGQFLKYTYIDASGATQSVYVDVSALLVEAEFESGVTANAAGVVHGVVDPTSEKDSQDTPVDFLTVGANGFKIDGIKNEIDKKLGDIVGDLDATVTDATSGNHVTITIEELDGKLVQSGLTIEENDIASASDLATLSAKTITDVKSTNGSVTVTPANAADGTQEIDLATDASKIKMTGFTTDNTKSLSAITTSSSVTEAFEEVQDVIDGVNDRIDDLENDFVSGVSVNGNAVRVSNHVAPISISGATSAMTSTSTEAIVVSGDTSTGAITLGLGTIDCGYYD